MIVQEVDAIAQGLAHPVILENIETMVNTTEISGTTGSIEITGSIETETTAITGTVVATIVIATTGTVMTESVLTGIDTIESATTEIAEGATLATAVLAEAGARKLSVVGKSSY